ncbi:MAG: Fic family protein [Bacteroidia bacterium]
MDALIQAAELKQQLDQLRPIVPEQEARIMQKFRLDWNYHSNNLEGNSLTYGETKALLMFGITAQGKPLKDHFEVTGHNEAIEWVTERVKGDYPLTQNFIRELHTLLLKEPYEVDAITPDGKPTKKLIKVGTYKSSPNHVQTKTGEIFYFATPEETPAKMADLLDWYTERVEAHDLNPILLAAEFHYKFISIHPFDDGNGRTARIIMNFILMKFGYPPVIIKTEDRANYFAALQLADSGQIEAFVDYIAQNLVRSLDIMIAGAKGESIEEPDDIDKEIALLEKRLSGLGATSLISKSKEAIDQVFDSVVYSFYSELKNNKLQKFYISSQIDFFLYKKVYKEGSGFEMIKSLVGMYHDFYGCKSKISNQTDSLELEMVFDTFNKIGFGGFCFKTVLWFKFNEISYSVLLGKKKYFEKPYGVSLTHEEMNKLLLEETKRHTAFIEKKITKKENGGSHPTT